MLGASLAIGIIMLASVTYFFGQQIDEQNIAIAKDVLTNIQNEIFLATKVESGYARDFEVPQALNNVEYNISIINGDIILSYKNIDFLGALPNVSGNIQKGENTVRNVDGKVCLNLGVC